jgi:AcrR family transcriptional regulator
MDAALDIFWEKGYLDTRVADIVKRAGVSHGSFYTYFKSKEDVLWALASDLHDILTDTGKGVRATTRGDEVATIEVATRRYLEEYLANRRIARLMEDVATFNEDMRAARHRTRATFVARVERSILRLQGENKADPKLDAYCSAEALISMVSHFAYHYVVTGSEIDKETAVHTLTTIWARGIGLPVE